MYEYEAPFETQPGLLGYPLVGKELGSGKDAYAYELGPDLVYRRAPFSIPFGVNEAAVLEFVAEHARREVAAYETLPAHTGVARTLSAWVTDRCVHKIIERAAGEPLHQSGEGITLVSDLQVDWQDRTQRVADIPQTHFDALVRGEAELRTRSIFMDYVGVSNLFYDDAAGFTIIDAEFSPQLPLKGQGMYGALIDIESLNFVLAHHEYQGTHLSSAARGHVIAVLEKLARAGHEPGKAKSALLFKSLCDRIGYIPAYLRESDQSDR